MQKDTKKIESRRVIVK